MGRDSESRAPLVDVLSLLPLLLSSSRAIEEYCLVTMAQGFHPFPSRTRKLSPAAPMVLPHDGGRVGRCQAFFFFQPRQSRGSESVRSPKTWNPSLSLVTISLMPVVTQVAARRVS